LRAQVVAVTELLFLCCHPALSPPSQLALALRGRRAVDRAGRHRVPGPETTVAQRITGRNVQLAEQDRGRWDATAIAEGRALLARTVGAGPVGQYQIRE